MTSSFWFWVFGVVLWFGGLLVPPIGMLAAYSAKAGQDLEHMTENGAPNEETKVGRLLHEEWASSVRYSLIWMSSWFLYFLFYGWWN